MFKNWFRGPQIIEEALSGFVRVTLIFFKTFGGEAGSFTCHSYIFK